MRDNPIIKTVNVVLPKNIKKLEVHTFADLHIGDAGCDMEAIKRHIEYVKNTENAYAILNGDLINNATKTSVSDCYAEELSPMEQIELCFNLFAPIKDKILCVTAGNHENRTYQKEGIDLSYLLARQLGIQDRFGREGVVLFLRFGQMNGDNHYRRVRYTFYITHGTGGGRKEGAKAIRLADMASIIDTDIYIHSHTHLPMIMKQSFFRIDINNSTVSNATKLFVNTSARLNYGGYGQRYEFKPSSKDNPIIYLSGVKKEFSAML